MRREGAWLVTSNGRERRWLPFKLGRWGLRRRFFCERYCNHPQQGGSTRNAPECRGTQGARERAINMLLTTSSSPCVRTNERTNLRFRCTRGALGTLPIEGGGVAMAEDDGGSGYGCGGGGGGDRLGAHECFCAPRRSAHRGGMEKMELRYSNTDGARDATIFVGSLKRLNIS